MIGGRWQVYHNSESWETRPDGVRAVHHIQIGLIDIADAKVYLGYWVEKLADPRSGWKPPEFYSELARFVEAYQYRGAAHLFEPFSHPLPSLGAAKMERP